MHKSDQQADSDEQMPPSAWSAAHLLDGHPEHWIHEPPKYDVASSRKAEAASNQGRTPKSPPLKRGAKMPHEHLQYPKQPLNHLKQDSAQQEAGPKVSTAFTHPRKPHPVSEAASFPSDSGGKNHRFPLESHPLGDFRPHPLLLPTSTDGAMAKQRKGPAKQPAKSPKDAARKPAKFGFPKREALKAKPAPKGKAFPRAGSKQQVMSGTKQRRFGEDPGRGKRLQQASIGQATIGDDRSVHLQDLQDVDVFRQPLKNTGDTEYTLTITVGGQEVAAIPDSGSFDLLVFSGHCTDCGNASNMYSSNKSPDHGSTGFAAEQTFGSGSTKSVESFDRVRLGDHEIAKQVFWEVVQVDASFADSSFQSILGVGPPASSLKIAEKEAIDVKRQAKIIYGDDDGDGLAQADEAIRHYADVVQHVSKQVPLLEAIGMRSYSVCLRPESGSDGVWIWNDDSVETHKDLFIKVPVVGDMYWSAEMRDVRFAPTPGAGHDSAVLGCDNERCSAVVDTGTSLLVVPTSAYDAILDALEHLPNGQHGCEDMSKLPDLRFTLGEQAFALGPESYMGSVDGELSEELLALMPRSRKSGDSSCTPLLMTINEDTDYGPLWILGLPFFRRYYTNFRLRQGSKAPESMAFASASPDCTAAMFQGLTRQPMQGHSHLRIDAKKIRAPSWLLTMARQQLARSHHAKHNPGQSGHAGADHVRG